MQTNQIEVKFGPDSATKTSDDPITVNDVKTDQRLRAFLNYGDNVSVLLNGVELPNDAVIPCGSTVRLQTRSNSKAV